MRVVARRGGRRWPPEPPGPRALVVVEVGLRPGRAAVGGHVDADDAPVVAGERVAASPDRSGRRRARRDRGAGSRQLRATGPSETPAPGAGESSTGQQPVDRGLEVVVGRVALRGDALHPLHAAGADVAGHHDAHRCRRARAAGARRSSPRPAAPRGASALASGMEPPNGCAGLASAARSGATNATCAAPSARARLGEHVGQPDAGPGGGAVAPPSPGRLAGDVAHGEQPGAAVARALQRRHQLVRARTGSAGRPATGTSSVADEAVDGEPPVVGVELGTGPWLRL